MRIESASEFVQAAVTAVVVLCWLALAAAFIFKARGPRPQTMRREPASISGIVLQAIGLACAWGLQRRTFSPLTPGPPAFALVLAGLAVALAVGSIWLTLSAIRILGKEWSFQARLVVGHRLVTEGPYRLVRHPIYTGMLGMLVATCLAVGHWIGLAPALLFYAAGTFIRVRGEERLLRAAFGDRYEEYTRRVPAVVPGLR